jgi:hypothetical protein
MVCNRIGPLVSGWHRCWDQCEQLVSCGSWKKLLIKMVTPGGGGLEGVLRAAEATGAAGILEHPFLESTM